MGIRREIYVTRKGLDNPIDIVYGTDLLPIEFEIMDFEIPVGATAEVCVEKNSKEPKKQVCKIAGNTVSFTPEVGFFQIGRNELQMIIMHQGRSLIGFQQKVIGYGCIPYVDAKDLEENPSLVGMLLALKMDADGNMYNTPKEAIEAQFNSIKGKIPKASRILWEGIMSAGSIELQVPIECLHCNGKNLTLVIEAMPTTEAEKYNDATMIATVCIEGTLGLIPYSQDGYASIIYPSVYGDLTVLGSSNIADLIIRAKMSENLEWVDCTLELTDYLVGNVIRCISAYVPEEMRV